MDDIVIIVYVYLYRLATVDLISALTGRSPNRVSVRLMKLTDNKYIARRDRGGPYEKYIYSLGTQGVELLVEKGIAPRELLNRRLCKRSDLFLKHDLLISRIHAVLEVAGRKAGIALVNWKQGSDVYDRVELSENGKRKKRSVRPDAFLTLEDSRRPAGQNRVNIFLEVDRSTTDHKRFQSKLKRYRAYFDQGLHTKKYGIKTARVLTTTLNKERQTNLCEAANKVLPPPAARFFYFTLIEHFSLASPGDIFSEILTTPRDYKTKRRYQLMPPLATQPDAT